MLGRHTNALIQAGTGSEKACLREKEGDFQYSVAGMWFPSRFAFSPGVKRPSDTSKKVIGPLSTL